MIYRKSLVISLCFIGFAYLSAFSQYNGGNADGVAFNTLTQTVCPPIASTNIFFGGVADGIALNTIR